MCVWKKRVRKGGDPPHPPTPRRRRFSLARTSNRDTVGFLFLGQILNLEKFLIFFVHP